MGCLKLHIEEEPTLRLAYSKKEVKPLKKVGRFYPFGLKIKGVNNVVVGTQNNYKYNGKELQTEALGGVPLQWYDYGARNYDASLGRFFNVDPLADAPMQVDKSPYAYTWNNPIRLTDPDGMHPDWNDGWLTGDISFGFDGFGFYASGSTGGNSNGRTSKEEKNQQNGFTNALAFEEAMNPNDWVEDAHGNIYWDNNATSQATTKSGEKYLGKNVLVGTHNRDVKGNEPLNFARFDLYLESNKNG